MYLAGVSVSRVEDITEALWGTKVSPGTISNLNKKAYEHISYEDMAKKTIIKKVLKFAPLKSEFQRALSNDNTIKHELSVDMSEVEPENTLIWK